MCPECRAPKRLSRLTTHHEIHIKEPRESPGAHRRARLPADLMTQRTTTNRIRQRVTATSAGLGLGWNFYRLVATADSRCAAMSRAGRRPPGVLPPCPSPTVPRQLVA